jgi:hypothetical protein
MSLQRDALSSPPHRGCGAGDEHVAVGLVNGVKL